MKARTFILSSLTVIGIWQGGAYAITPVSDIKFNAPGEMIGDPGYSSADWDTYKCHRQVQIDYPDAPRFFLYTHCGL
jgi:hypothetical protein